MQWGAEKADAVQARIYLEATPEGYPLYCKYAFKVVDETSLDFTTSFGGVGKQNFHIMVREPQARAV